MLQCTAIKSLHTINNEQMDSVYLLQINWCTSIYGNFILEISRKLNIPNIIPRHIGQTNVCFALK